MTSSNNFWDRHKKNIQNEKLRYEIAFGILKAIGALVGIGLVMWLLYEIRIVLIYIVIASVFSLKPSLVSLSPKHSPLFQIYYCRDQYLPCDLSGLW